MHLKANEDQISVIIIIINVIIRYLIYLKERLHNS